MSLLGKYEIFKKVVREAAVLSTPQRTLCREPLSDQIGKHALNIKYPHASMQDSRGHLPTLVEHRTISSPLCCREVKSNSAAQSITCSPVFGRRRTGTSATGNKWYHTGRRDLRDVPTMRNPALCFWRTTGQTTEPTKHRYFGGGGGCCYWAAYTDERLTSCSRAGHPRAPWERHVSWAAVVGAEVSLGFLHESLVINTSLVKFHIE